MNLYATLEEVKDQIDLTSNTDDSAILSLINTVSRMIDRITGKFFYPQKQTVYLNSIGGDLIYLPDYILELNSLEISDDNGDTYEPLTQEDYFLTNGVDYREPYNSIYLNPNGDQSSFYSGTRAIKIDAVWGFNENYSNAWADSGSVLLGDVNNSTTTFPVDPDNTDVFGLYSSVSLGGLLKVNSEVFYPTFTDSVNNEIKVIRGFNGFDSDSHTAGDTVYKWMVHPIVRQATIIQTVRTWKRAETAFQDTTANQNTGQLRFLQKLDPEVELMLFNSGLVKLNVG